MSGDNNIDNNGNTTSHRENNNPPEETLSCVRCGSLLTFNYEVGNLVGMC